jgi:hypothetical protein
MLSGGKADRFRVLCVVRRDAVLYFCMVMYARFIRDPFITHLLIRCRWLRAEFSEQLLHATTTRNYYTQLPQPL